MFGVKGELARKQVLPPRSRAGARSRVLGGREAGVPRAMMKRSAILGLAK
jgi:hypothetical protein